MIPSYSAGKSVGSLPSLVILSDTKAYVMAIPIVLRYKAAIARWSAAPLSTPYLSHSPEDSESLFVSSSPTPSVPHSGPSRRRSRLVSISSSSGTSRPSSVPLPHRRHLVSSYSTPSTSVGPSHKRCRSPTTSRPTSTYAPTIPSSVHVDRLPPCKRLRGLPIVLYQDVTVEAAAKPVSPPVHHGLTVEERLDEQSKTIREMYEHLLDMPLSRIKELEQELHTLRARVVSSERESTSLRARVRTAELSDVEKN
ncbi:hypothetical protein Tco_0791986 [Tanacetum coccineum]